MRKKQLFALALAGMLTVSMAPAASAADVDEQASEAAVAQSEGGNEQTGDMSGFGESAQAENGAEPENNTEETGAQAPAQGEGESESPEVPETPETPAVPETPTETEAPAPETPGETEAPTQEQDQVNVTEETGKTSEAEETKEETSEDTSNVEAATASEIVQALTAAAAAEDGKVTIKLTQDRVAVGETITVPAGVTATLISTSASGTSFVRDGAFTGTLFQVDGSLTLGGEGNTGLVVNGGLGDGADASQVSSMVKVTGTFVANGTIFQNNPGTESGGAISSTGATTLNGVTISGNTGSDGGGVYATAPVVVSGLVTIADNTNSEGSADNLSLSGEAASLELAGDLTEGSRVNVHLNAENEMAGVTIVKASEGVTVDWEKNLTYLTYDDTGKHWFLDWEKESDNFLKMVRLGYVKNSLTRESFTRAVASLKAYGYEGGTIYTAWTVRGAYTDNDVPADSDFKEAGTIDSEEFQVVYDDLNEVSVDCYVFVKDTEGNASEVIRLQPKDMEAPVTHVSLSASAVSRVSLSEATFKLTTENCSGGKYYYTWTKRGAGTPDYSQMKLGGTISKDTFQVSVKDITEKSVDCYFYVEDADGNKSSIVKVQPKDWADTKPTMKYVSSTRKSLEEMEFTLQTTNAIGGQVWLCWTKRGAYTGNSGPRDGYLAVATITSDEMKVSVSDITEESIDCYVYVTDKNGTKSSVYRFKPADWISATPTPTPEPKLVDANNSQVVGLDNSFVQGAKVIFGVFGAGMDNSAPNKGDNRFVPYRWKASDKQETVSSVIGWTKADGTPQGTFQQSSNGYYYGSTAATTSISPNTYPLYIVLKEQEYDGTQWVDKPDSYALLAKQFTIVANSATPTTKPNSYSPGTTYTDDSGTQYEVLDDGTIVTVAPNATSANDGSATGKDAVATSDETPIVPMVSLLMASLLAGGYVITRRRKKTME